jgi:hypothetical protein
MTTNIEGFYRPPRQSSRARRQASADVRAAADALRHIYLVAFDETYATHPASDVVEICDPAVLDVLREFEFRVRQRTIEEVRTAWEQRE